MPGLASPERPRRRARRWIVALGGLLLLAVAAGYLAVGRLRPLAGPAGWAVSPDLAEYTAVMHVHSAFSHDGRGTIEEIAEAARQANVDVVFLTEHNTFRPLAEGRERWYGETLVLIGAEITTGSGYLLVLDPRPDLPAKARGFGLDDLVRRYREAGALVLLAHPEHPRLGWRGDLPPIDGLEVIDLFDQLLGVALWRQSLGLLAYPANPTVAILSAVHWPRSVMQRWDAMAREQPTIGVLALDAHGGIALAADADLSFPSHATAFRLGQLHFVTDEPLGRDAADRTRVYRALRGGRFYNAFDGFAPARGFRFEVRQGESRALMGDSVPFREGQVAAIRVPPVGQARVRLLRDGQVLREEPVSPSPWTVGLPGPGVYRVEVDLHVDLFPIGLPGFRPWIFSNPVYVRP